MLEIGFFEAVLLLFIVAAFAGWVDAIAGGGGMITIPTLLLIGLPPSTALATNKVQGTAGSLIASLVFIRQGLVDLNKIKALILMTFIGSVIGSWLVLKIDSTKLTIFLPVLLIAVGIYFLLSPNISDEDKLQRLSLTGFALIISPIVGFYDGFFGPGTGSFITLAFVLLCGYGIARATAHAKVLNLTSNIASLGYFSLYGEIYWSLGIVMIFGQIFGATLGAKMVLKQGAKLVKPLLVCVCFLMSLSIFIKEYL